MISLKKLPLPCPINSLYRATTIRLKNGRIVSKVILSKRARLVKSRLIFEINQQLGGRPTPMVGDVQVAYTITPRDRRTPDCDAYAKHLLDCLQAAGVFLNDNQVVQISQERMPIAKAPGHLDVQIWTIA